MKHLTLITLLALITLALANPPLQIPVINGANIPIEQTLAYIFYDCELGMCASPLDVYGLNVRLRQGQYLFWPEGELYMPDGRPANIRITAQGFNRMQGVRGISYGNVTHGGSARYGMMIDVDFTSLDVVGTRNK